MKTIFFIIFCSALFAAEKIYAQNIAKGWENLFDGKTLNGWKKLAGNAEYEVEDGAIVGKTILNTPNTFLVTDKEFGDFILEMEVMIKDTTSNSGIQFRSHFDPAGNGGNGKVYGYQFELDPSSRRWTGGIYDEGRRDWLYPLSLHSSAQHAFNINVYNKIKLECIGHTLKTWVNNIPAAYVVDTVDNNGFIALQVHSIGDNSSLSGKKIYWKNIRIKTSHLSPSEFSKNAYVMNFIPNNLSAFEKKNGWKLLFDGKSSTGWKGAYKKNFPEIGWQINNGLLSVISSEGKESANGGDIVTEEEYGAFDLSFDFIIAVGANSGLKYFVTLAENNTGSAIGLEYQILDDKNHPDAKMGIAGNRTLASLYDLIPAMKQDRFVHPPGQWNTGRIVVSPDNHVEQFLNGIKVLEYERGSEDFRKLVAISKYKIWPSFGEAKKGHILLQDHGDAASFRSIKLRVLK